MSFSFHRDPHSTGVCILMNPSLNALLIIYKKIKMEESFWFGKPTCKWKQGLKVSKASGLDNISLCMVKDAAVVVAKPLTHAVL